MSENNEFLQKQVIELSRVRQSLVEKQHDLVGDYLNSDTDVLKKISQAQGLLDNAISKLEETIPL